MCFTPSHGRIWPLGNLTFVFVDISVFVQHMDLEIELCLFLVVGRLYYRFLKSQYFTPKEPVSFSWNYVKGERG